MTSPAERLAIPGTVRDRGASRLAMAGVIALAILLILALGLTGQTILLALVPFAMLAAIYWIACLPMRSIMLTLLTLGLLADNPASRPYGGAWRTWLSPIGDYLYDNLNNHIGISALRFSGLDALVVFLVILVAARLMLGSSVDRRGQRVNTAAALTVGLASLLLTLVWLEAWGLSHAGDFKNSLWQILELLWLPVLAGLFAYALKGPRDFAAIARIIIGAACVKVALGVYFNFVVAPRLGIQHEYATTHDDTLLFVTAAVICISAYVHRPSRGHLVLMLTAVPWLLFGIIVNDRRIAYVSLAGALFVIYSLLRGPVKRAVTRVAFMAMPLVFAYVIVGRNRPHGIFTPAAKIMSVVLQKDASSNTRDIEDYNLIITLKQAPILGSGFGHMYTEVSKAYDISKNFAQYRFIAHNSILWLWSIAGLIGFTTLWMFLPIAIFLGTRAYHHARTPLERTAAASVVAAVVIYMVQAWGDMGSQSWPGVVMMSCLLAMAAKLAVATGAWPAGISFLQRSRRPAVLSGATGRSLPHAAP
jgi:O-antigen ligase